MSNINKRELSAWTWKTNWVFLAGSIAYIIAIPFIWITEEVNLITGAVIAGFLLFLSYFMYTMYKKPEPSLEKFQQDPEERQKIIESYVLETLEYRRYNPKIEGSEEQVRGDIKTVLLKLAEEY